MVFFVGYVYNNGMLQRCLQLCHFFLSRRPALEGLSWDNITSMMEEILHQLTSDLPHFFSGFLPSKVVQDFATTHSSSNHDGS